MSPWPSPLATLTIGAGSSTSLSWVPGCEARITSTAFVLLMPPDRNRLSPQLHHLVADAHARALVSDVEGLAYPQVQQPRLEPQVTRASGASPSRSPEGAPAAR